MVLSIFIADESVPLRNARFLDSPPFVQKCVSGEAKRPHDGGSARKNGRVYLRIIVRRLLDKNGTGLKWHACLNTRVQDFVGEVPG